MSELKPCPVCGGRADFDKDDFDKDDHDWNWVYCMSCGLSTDPAKHDVFSALDKSAKLWNNRPHEDQIKADAIMECLAYAMERSAVQNTVYIKDVVTWVDKLRGNK